jgi:hypothetical protein
MAQNMTEAIKTKAELYNDPATGRFIDGNPGGQRPKGSRSFTSKVRDALEKIAKSEDGVDITYEEALIKAILHKAIIKKDARMMQIIWEQLDGKPNQKLDLTSLGQQLVFSMNPNQIDKLDKLLDDQQAGS